MFKNYFKIAWRNLRRNKGFSITNILGLTIGITCTILIALWVYDEVSYDKFHKNYDNIYQVIANRDFNNHMFTDPNMVLPLARTLEGSTPQLVNTTVTAYTTPVVIKYGDEIIQKSGKTVNEHFFDVFTFKFIRGNKTTAFADPYSVVMTESTAGAIFGRKDPIGQVIKLDNGENYKVTAVIEDVPGNSTLQFDFLRPFNYSDPNTKAQMEEWQNSSWQVYLQMKPGANMAMMEKKINDIKHERDKNDKISTYFAFPMNRWRLYSDFKEGKSVGGLIEYVRMFTIIAVVILLIACINFMNLSTARSEKRAKEVGIRKTLGSNKSQLIMQFFSESVLLALIAFVLSLAAVYFLLPSFNELVEKQLKLNILDPSFWILALIIILFTGMVAGSYPALYLSSFNPVKVLKGTLLAGRDSVLPRRVLVVAQFVISISLISATIIIYQQIKYIRGREMGYDPDNLVMVSATGDINRNYTAIRDELMKTGLVSSVNRTSSPITQIWWRSGGPDYEGKRPDANVIFSGLAADSAFTKTFGIKVLEGRDFTGQPVDSSAVILNKAAVMAMGLKNAVGMKLRFGRNPTENIVVGVIDNVVMDSPFKPVDPMFVFYDPNFVQKITVRLKDGEKPAGALASFEKVFKKYNPAFPFDYQFVDQEFAKKFTGEQLINRITNIFAGLAIFICCIGLAGLASFMIEKRTREIGIRKVLGANVQQLIALISKEFLKLVAVAFLVAVPIAWWFMNSWLQNYEFRVRISIWLFGIVGLLVLILALLVVGANTLKAATTNPVKSLRTE
ncbi:MAG: ABC transporter permease [Chitinophagaceae bacterium]|nr:ABC transporter permease [Chitinophagaceae bacterium]